jgi:hypothetical protein
MAEDNRPGGRRRDQERAAADLPIPRHDGGGSVASDDDEASDGDFEFPFVSREPAVADELFAGGRIRPLYPVFGRVLDDAAAAAPSSRAPLGRLFQLEQARASSVASTSSSSSAAADAEASGLLDGAPPDSYCLWAPGSSPASSPSRHPPRKSGSTGSIARWRRIGDLVVGRSRSDGRHKFLFLSAPPSPARDGDHHHSPAGSKSKPPTPKGSKVAAAAAAAAELDTVAAGRRMSYGGGKASPGGRRTFLPYRQGLFGNAHGLSRSPF